MTYLSVYELKVQKNGVHGEIYCYQSIRLFGILDCDWGGLCTQINQQ